MAENSKIEWTDTTWNPVTGCSIVSPGCHNCYAMRMAARLEAMGQAKYAGTTKKTPTGYQWSGRINTDESSLTEPLIWKKPRRVFVNSMSDLFHEDVPNVFIAEVFATMYEAQWHTFQILTKRARRLEILENPRFAWAVGRLAWNRLRHRAPEKAAVLTEEEVSRDVMDNWPLPNVWLGVSAEDQKRAEERVPWLLRTPAAVRFISAEPLLGPIDFEAMTTDPPNSGLALTDGFGRFDGEAPAAIHWVIVGGESGHGLTRPMHPDWARGLRDQCQAAGVPFFFKQWGECCPTTTFYKTLDPEMVLHMSDGIYPVPDDVPTIETIPGRGKIIRGVPYVRCGKKAAGRLLDGREWNEFPQIQETHT